MKNRVFASSALFAALICCNSLPVLFGESSGIVAGTVVALWGALCALELRSGQKPNSTAIVIAVLLLIAHLLSYAFHPSEIGTRYLSNYLIYGALFLLIPMGNIDFNRVLKIAFYYGVILLPFYARYDYGYGINEVGEFEGGILMTMSYRMLPFILAALFVTLNKTNKVWERVLGIVVITLYLLIFLIVGARGAITSLFAFLAIYYIISGKERMQKIARLSIMGIVAIVFFTSFDFIIDYLFNLLDTRGVSSRSIERMYYSSIAGGDVSAGRFKIYKMAFNEFLQSPIWGNGIGSFDSYKGTFPHNIFLQLMVEGGLFFVIPFTVLLIRGLVYIFEKGGKTASGGIMLFVFCSGMIRLFFSSYLWGSHFCWLFILLALNIKVFRKNERNSISNNNYI